MRRSGVARAALPKKDRRLLNVQFVGCERCGETEKTLRRVDGVLLCPRCAGRPVPKSGTAAPGGARGSRLGPLVLQEIDVDKE